MTRISVWTEPGNRKDRRRFAALTDDRRVTVAARARALYDGSRTVARCWVEALEETR